MQIRASVPLPSLNICDISQMSKVICLDFSSDRMTWSSWWSCPSWSPSVMTGTRWSGTVRSSSSWTRPETARPPFVWTYWTSLKRSVVYGWMIGNFPNIYVVRHHESHIMSEKKYFSFWQIWILQIPSFKSIYNLPYFIVSKMQKKKWRKARKLYGPIQLSKCFSCFWGFYDLRLYTGNVITHHICEHLLNAEVKNLKASLHFAFWPNVISKCVSGLKQYKLFCVYSVRKCMHLQFISHLHLVIASGIITQCAVA